MARKGFFQGMEERIIKNKVREALAMIKAGKEQELFAGFESVDYKKLDEYTLKYDSKKIAEMGIDVEALKSEIPPEIISEFKNKIKAFPRELEERITKLLNI